MDIKQENELVQLAKCAWESNPHPVSFSEIKVIDFFVLEDIVLKSDIARFELILDDLVRGAIYIVKNAFSRQEVDFIKDKAHALKASKESQFFKMNSKIPNFWRDITPEVGLNYGVPVVKESFYFFHWKGEEQHFSLVNRRWDIIKILGGKPSTFGKFNVPEDGVVDRIQIVKYPPGSGFVAPHQDPTHNQIVFLSGYLSEVGSDFQSGGFWAQDQDGVRVNLESFINAGDLGIACSNLIHGVDNVDDNSTSERWWLGLYTNDSDCVSNRVTIKSPSIAA